MRLNRFLIFVLLAGLLGCHASYAANVSGNNLPGGFVGKPHAPIEMEYVLPKTIVAGQKLNIRLTMTTTQDVDALDVVVRFADALQAASRLQWSFGRMTRQQGNQFEIACIPQRNGMFYVYLQATLTIDGQQQSRSFTIPVNVGNVDVHKQLKATGVVEEDAHGERVISMPAKESRKPTK